MTAEAPIAPRLVDLLPVDPEKLRDFVLGEHPARQGQLGCRWWQIARDSYEGTGGFMRSVSASQTRDGGPGNGDAGTRTTTGRSTYLTPFRREQSDAFEARANRSAYTNHVAPVVDVYHGHLRRRAPKRKAGAAELAAWWVNVDGQGHAIDEWVGACALRAQLYGWLAVLVDRPDTSDRGAARTEATALAPEEIRDWQVGGDGLLDWVRIVSEWCVRDPFSPDVVEVVEATVWTRAEWARVRLEKRDGAWSVVDRSGLPHPLGRVPLAVLRWQEQLDPRAFYGLSQVQGVVPLALGLFNNESEYTDHLANANFALLARQVRTLGSSDSLTLGTGNGMEYEQGCAAPAFVAPGADVAVQYALRSEQLVRAIYTAAKLERPGAEPTAPESGVAKAYDFSQTDAGLQTFARQITRWEFELAALALGWATSGGVAADDPSVLTAIKASEIVYPTRFDAAGIQGDLGAMFAVLDEKVRAQFPPEALRQARLALARNLFPEASPDVEKRIADEINAMFAADVRAMGSASTDASVAGAADAASAIADLPPDPAATP